MHSLIRIFTCAFCIAKDVKFVDTDSEGPDQTAWMRRLICLCWGHMSEDTFLFHRCSYDDV